MPDERPEQAQVPPPLHSHVPNLEQFLQELYLFRAQYEASQTLQQVDLQSVIDALSNRVSANSALVPPVSVTSNKMSIAIAVETSNRISAGNVLSNAISVVSNAVSTVSTLRTADLTLLRDAANVLALRNSANAQSFQVYKSISGGDKEYLVLEFNAGDNAFRVRAAQEAAGLQWHLELQAASQQIILFNDGGPEIRFVVSGGISHRFFSNAFRVEPGVIQLGTAPDIFLTRKSAGVLQISNTVSATNVNAVSVGGLGGIQMRVVGNVQGISATALANISGLSASVTSSAVYQIEGMVLYQMSVADTVGFGLTFPAGVIAGVRYQGTSAVGQAAGVAAFGNEDASASIVYSVIPAAALSTNILRIDGIFQVSTTAGIVQVQARVSAAGSPVNIQRGSYLRAYKIG